MSQPTLGEAIAREGKVVEHCLRVIDRGLRRCNAALEALQPKQPGRITLLETKKDLRGKTQLTSIRWRVVRWRIRYQKSDGEVVWEAEPLPLTGAGRRVSSRFAFHDTEAQVRQALKAAIALIAWRGRVLQTASNFMNGMHSHNLFGIEQAAKNIDIAARAADEGARIRTRVREEAARIAREQSGA